jgi:two-component system C4-dicarboxylate transport response regulator DctD
MSREIKSQRFAAQGLALAHDRDAARVALVVDDEPLIRRFVSTVLRREGWSVLEASDALSALALAQDEPPDLLVTDFDMPNVTGTALAERLREVDRDLPVLLVSGHPDAALSIRGLHGRTAFASKPFIAADLVARVDALLN